MLRGEPVGVVFGEHSVLDGDDVLKQLDSVPDLAVGRVGAGELVLRGEPGGVVFGEVTPPLARCSKCLTASLIRPSTLSIVLPCCIDWISPLYRHLPSAVVT